MQFKHGSYDSCRLGECKTTLSLWHNYDVPRAGKGLNPLVFESESDFVSAHATYMLVPLHRRMGNKALSRRSKHMKGSNERYLLGQSMRIFGGILFIKLQNDT